MPLFNERDGKFTTEAVGELGALDSMFVELDYGPGTELAHWDEATHGLELMTGLKNDASEHVLPVTISVLRLLGHRVLEELDAKADLNELLDAVSQVTFSRHADAKAIDRDYFEETDLMEVVPHTEPLTE